MLDVGEVVGLVEGAGEGLEDGLVEGFAGDGFGLAVTATGGAGADVAGVGLGVFVGGGGAEVGGSAKLAVEKSGEEVGGVDAAWVLGVGAGEVVAVVVFLDLVLDGGPGGLVDDGLAVVGDDEVGEVEFADVEGVGEEGFVGVEGGEEVGGVVDLGEGFADRAHLEGLLDEGG